MTMPRNGDVLPFFRNGARFVPGLVGNIYMNQWIHWMGVAIGQISRGYQFLPLKNPGKSGNPIRPNAKLQANKTSDHLLAK